MKQTQSGPTVQLKRRRALLRLNNGTGVSVQNVASKLSISRADARREVDALVADGWLQPIPVRRVDVDYWVPTPQGAALLTTSRATLSRVRADAVLAEFLARVPVVNADPRLAYTVDVAIVFGNYLSDRPKIGDVDVAIRLADREPTKAAQWALEDRVRETYPGGGNMVDHICWPMTQVRRALKARSPVLDVRELSEIESICRDGAALPYRVLVGAWSPPH